MRKTHHGDNEKLLTSLYFPPLDIETNSLTEEQVDEMSLRIENKLTRKMRDDSKKSENNILEALISLSRTHYAMIITVRAPR